MFFVAHYISSNGSAEFYSSLQEDINFPIQVKYKGENYVLEKTYQIPSRSFISNIEKTAQNYGIDFDVDTNACT